MRPTILQHAPDDVSPRGHGSAVERHGYAPPAGRRPVALGLSCAIYAVLLCVFFFTIRTVDPTHAPSAPTIVSFIPLASPPPVPPADKQAPKPVLKIVEPPNPIKMPPVERTLVATAATPMPVGGPPTLPSSSQPPEPETVAPRSVQAPPAAKAASDAPDSWEGRVLAALHKQRRYPRLAMVRRQQGVPYIRFTMNRDGIILTSLLERSSGYPDLDREAVALAKRASPLPKPPVGKSGDTLELIVPVEFFLQ